MRIFFTDHALERLAIRDISLADVRSIAERPDYIRPSHDNVVLIGKKFESETIEIACTRKFDKIVVITIYFK